MSNLRIEFEWQDPGGAKGEELRATWASLSILIDNHPVTELLDQKTKSVRSSIFLPLFPLAEWIADNWWFLQAEAEAPDKSSDVEFDRRHNFRWAREGFVLPSLRFVTLGERNVAAQWQPLDIPGAAIRFLSSGSAVLPASNLIENLRNLVSAVIARLDDSAVTGTTLHEQWLAIENADVEEREFCRAAARLGSDPYAMDDRLEKTILNVAHTIRSELLQDFLSLANPLNLHAQADALKSASDSIEEDDDNVNALASVCNRAPRLRVNGASPWEIGYEFAIELRRSLGGVAWKSRSLEELASHLNINDLDRCLLDHVDCTFFDALTGTNRCNNPKFIIEKTRPESKQFAFCRALFEHLTLAPGRFAAVSRLRTERQQMNRAFAAEFLAPHEMLRSDLSATTVGEEEIENLAVDYGVSTFVIRHQIENHQLACVAL